MQVLCNILIQFGIHMKLVRLIKLCLTETFGRVRVGKHLYDMFPIRIGLKQGDALSPLLFNFGLKYAIWRVQVNQDGLQLNGTCQILICADDFFLLFLITPHHTHTCARTHTPNQELHMQPHLPRFCHNN